MNELGNVKIILNIHIKVLRILFIYFLLKFVFSFLMDLCHQAQRNQQKPKCYSYLYMYNKSIQNIGHSLILCKETVVIISHRSVILDDAPDPGYSIIRRARPASAYSNGSGAQTPQSDDSGNALYAVIDKTRKNRATIHISQNVESDLERQFASAASRENINNQNIYAQVNKPSSRENSPSVLYDNPGTAYAGSGARPKIRSRSTDESPYSNNAELSQKVSEAGYQSIPGDDSNPYARIKEDPYSRVKDDPYSRVKDDPYSRVKDDPYTKVKDVPYSGGKEDPYAKVKDDPYSKIKDHEPPYAKVKDSDSAGYSRIMDVNNVAGKGSSEDIGYSKIKDVPSRQVDDLEGDPNYDHIPSDNITTVHISPGYATEISANEISDGNNNPNAAQVSMSSRSPNRTDHMTRLPPNNIWSRREHLYEEIGSSGSQRREEGRQFVRLHRPQHPQYGGGGGGGVSTDL